jgi:hypothetical protein
MSVDISISNSRQQNCNQIIEKLLKAGIDARVIETTNIINNNIQKGCLITVGKEYNDQKKLTKLWNIISKDYICSHLKITGLFDGCIYEYFSRENHLIKKALKQEDLPCPYST